jgi:hypothetical protein
MVVLMRLIAGNPPWRASGHDQGQDGGDGDDGDREVSATGRCTPRSSPKAARQCSWSGGPCLDDVHGTRRVENASKIKAGTFEQVA